MAVRFDAATEQYSATNGLPGNVYTFTAWVRPETLGASNRVVYWLTTSGDVFTGIEFRDNASTDLQAYDSSTYAFNGLGPLAATAGTWYRVALVVNGATATFYRSAAGSALGSASVSDFTTPASPSTWYLGDDPYDEWFDGRLAAVKVWGAALTAAEVEHELAQYVPGRTANLLRWHSFVAAETVDYSGNGNTLSGGTGSTTEDGPPIPWARLAPRIIVSAVGGGAVALDGTASAAASLAGSADVDRPLTGAGTAAAVLSGGLSADRPVAGTASAASSLTGTITTARALTGTGTAASGLTGAVEIARPLTGTASASSGVSGALDTARPLSATASAAAGLSGDATVSRALDATTPAANSATGSLTAERPVSGHMSAASSATGELTVSTDTALDGTATAAASFTAGLSLDRPLAGVVSSSAHAAGAVAVARMLDATASAATGFAGVFTADRPLAGAASMASGATATLTVTGAVSRGSMSAPTRTGPAMVGAEGTTATMTGG